MTNDSGWYHRTRSTNAKRASQHPFIEFRLSAPGDGQPSAPTTTASVDIRQPAKSPLTCAEHSALCRARQHTAETTTERTTDEKEQ